jgi:hypothetical protein
MLHRINFRPSLYELKGEGLSVDCNKNGKEELVPSRGAGVLRRPRNEEE